MSAIIDLRLFKGYQFLGNEEEDKVKRDILKKLSRKLKNQNQNICCSRKHPSQFAGHGLRFGLSQIPRRPPLRSELLGE